MIPVRRVCVSLFLLCGMIPAAPAGQLSREITEKIDAAIASAYLAASAKLPCKIAVNFRYRMLRWQDVDKCMDQAQNRVNWEELLVNLKSLRPPGISEGDFAAAVESSLSRQALSYDKIFQVKGKNVLLPLTVPILKYLPPDSLMDQPIFDQKGKQQLGTFAGVFFYEHSGGLAGANPYRLAQFQYKDLQGKIQVPSDRLLFDSYGVPWEKVKAQPGFRLTNKALEEIRVR